MGQFTEELGRLGADISRLRQARLERLEEGRDRTRMTVEAARAALRQQATVHRKMASALHRSLRQNTAQRVASVGDLLREMRKTHFQRAKQSRRERGRFVTGIQHVVSGLRNDVHRFLREGHKPVAEFGADFREGARRMHVALQGHAQRTRRPLAPRSGKRRNSARR
jgi:hypothetical protein